MGLNFAKNDLFMGEKFVHARTIMRALRKAKWDPFEIARLRSVPLDPRTVAAILSEFDRRGLTERNDGAALYGTRNINIQGAMVHHAVCAPRFSKSDGWRAVDRMLKRCEQLNTKDDVPLHIAEVWLMGSILGDGPDLGDVDVVIGKSYPPHIMKLPEPMRQQQSNYESAIALGISPERPPNAEDVTPAGRWISAFIKGPAHPHRIQVVNGAELLELGCPCQLVFSATQGGRVAAPVLPRHPGVPPGHRTFHGRQIKMPDLRSPLAAPIRTVALGDLAAFVPQANPNHALTRLLPGRSCECRASCDCGKSFLDSRNLLNLRHFKQYRAIAELKSWIPPAISNRTAFAMSGRGADGSLKTRAVISLEREFSRRGKSVEYLIKIDGECWKKPLQVNDANVFADLVLFAAGADMQTFTRTEEADPCPVKLVAAGASTGFASRIKELVASFMSKYPQWSTATYSALAGAQRSSGKSAPGAALHP